jgi:hypothetical protein
MSNVFRPRISQARELFPIVRAHLVASAALHSLPAGLSLDLLPIVEDGLAGYEILPNRATQTYLTIGWDRRGRSLVRESSYRDGRPATLRVAAVDGQARPAAAMALRRLRQRDTVFSDWPSAAEAVWSELSRQFPHEPRHTIELHDLRQEELDEALATAYRHLAERDPQIDPQIDFCGVPDEAQYGFALTDPKGGRGYLVARHPETWSLWFESPAGSVREEWPMLPGSTNPSEGWVRASSRPLPDAASGGVHVLAAASRRIRLRDREGDRRHGERRDRDRRLMPRFSQDRRQGERRQTDRRQAHPGGSHSSA